MRKLTSVVVLLSFMLSLVACGGGGGGNNGGNTNYTVGGSVSGLTGTLVLQNNAGDDLSITTNGNFTFNTALNDSTNFSVTVLSQPTGQSCSVSSASGTLASANVTSVSVVCSDISGSTTYTVGGSVSGLTGTLVLQNNGGDDLSLSTNGSFTFNTALNDSANYSVSVLSQPAGQNCIANNSSGTLSSANITSVSVVCSDISGPATYTVGGTVSGLTGTLVIKNNGGDDLSLSTNGSFTFNTALNDSANYSVSVLSQPTGQACSVSSASGTLASANVTSVSVVCITTSYTVGGTVSGLTGTLVLRNNGGDDLSLSTNGSFTFNTALNDSANYSVSILSQPTGQSCSVSSASGTVSGANVTSVGISCTANAATTYQYSRVSVTNPVTTALTVSTSDLTQTYDLTHSTSTFPSSYEFTSSEYRELTTSDINISNDFRATCALDSVGVDPNSSITQLINISCTWNSEIVTVYDTENHAPASTRGLTPDVAVDDNGGVLFQWEIDNAYNKEFYHISADGSAYTLLEAVDGNATSDGIQHNAYDFFQDKKSGDIVASRSLNGAINAWTYEYWLNHYANGQIYELYRDDPSVSFGELATKYNNLDGIMSGKYLYSRFLKIFDGKILYQTKNAGNINTINLYDVTSQATFSVDSQFNNNAVLYQGGFIYVNEGATWRDNEIYNYDAATNSNSVLVNSNSINQLCSTGVLDYTNLNQLVKNPASNNKNLTFVVACNYEYDPDIPNEEHFVHYDAAADSLSILESWVGISSESVWVKERINGDFVYGIDERSNTDTPDTRNRVQYFNNTTKQNTTFYVNSRYYSYLPLETSNYVMYDSLDNNDNHIVKIFDGTNHLDFTITLAAFSDKLSNFDNSENFLVRTLGNKIYRIDINKYVELYKAENNIM